MGTIALNATAGGGSVQLKAGDTLTTDEVLQVFSNDISSKVLTGVDLTAVGIVGTSPEATLWANGDITGSSSNGSFTKYANGDLRCYGNAVTVASATSLNTFPLVFSSPPSMSGISTHSDSDWGSNPKLRNITVTTFNAVSITISAYTGHDHSYYAGTFSYQAFGRWL